MQTISGVWVAQVVVDNACRARRTQGLPYASPDRAPRAWPCSLGSRCARDSGGVWHPLPTALVAIAIRLLPYRTAPCAVIRLFHPIMGYVLISYNGMSIRQANLLLGNLGTAPAAPWGLWLQTSETRGTARVASLEMHAFVRANPLIRRAILFFCTPDND